MVKAELCQPIAPTKAMPDMPNGRRHECCQRRGNATHIGWRTKWQHRFRMSQLTPFRMKTLEIQELLDLKAKFWLGREESY